MDSQDTSKSKAIHPDKDKALWPEKDKAVGPIPHREFLKQFKGNRPRPKAKTQEDEEWNDIP